MKRSRSLLILGAAAAAGTALLVWGYPYAAPLRPHPFRASAGDAQRLVLDTMRQLGRPVDRPYVLVHFSTDAQIERRLQLELEHEPLAKLQATGLPEQVSVWEVIVYPPDAFKDDYTAKAQVSPAGRLVSLHFRADAEARGGMLDPAVARRRADDFLRSQGVDLGRFHLPEVRTQQLAARIDTTLHYHGRDQLSGGGVGLEVKFAGDRVSDYGPWIEEGSARHLVQRSLQSTQLMLLGIFVFSYGLLAVLTIPFLRHYHEGEIGVRRGLELFAVVGAAGMLVMALVTRSQLDEVNLAFATPQQASLLFMMFAVLFNVMPLALLAFLAWSVGEWSCRRQWGDKLTSFDALFRRRWTNATVAFSSLAGVLAGLALAGLAVGLLLAVRRFGAWPVFGLMRTAQTGWMGIEEAASRVGFLVPVELVIALCVLPLLARWLGRSLGLGLTALIAAIAIWLPVPVLPLGWGVVVSALFAGALLLVFVCFDLLAFLLAMCISSFLLSAYPVLAAPNLALQAGGWLGLAVLALPLWLSIGYVASKREITYRYEDVPPHVRRIAERERQRVELETARRIQSSILPDLPPRLAGVDLAHAYLPASEVGGDFYDVLALEDGRLALAVGDVAGHGVSSGLVMSMAKSALAVQVTFDPDVDAVFRTLNRTVYQTARKRLLATFCYALLDPVRRELLYASAGHLFPYRVTAAGKVEALEASGYPLGVRRTIEVEPRLLRLGAGDALFMFSDGLVEARAEGSDDLFGFDRLEESLARHAGASVEGLRDLVLADVAEFVRHAPREDDITVLVVRLPA
jgi:hypothetical protein